MSPHTKSSRQGKGGGPKTLAGKERQITARVSNGVHFQSPVLPGGIESQEAWEAHLASLEEALQPVGAWEKLCVYRVALSAWKHFRLVRHEVALSAAAICNPANEFKSTYDDDYVHPGDVAEVITRSEKGLEGELLQMRDLATRVSALSNDGEGVTFSGLERRQILSAIIEQPTYRIGESEDDAPDALEDDGEELASNMDTNDDAADNEETVIISAAQLRAEIEQIMTAKGIAPNEAIQELAATMAEEIKNRQRRLKLARSHIGVCMIADERNVNRLAFSSVPWAICY